jgi:hypothetical protein
VEDMTYDGSAMENINIEESKILVNDKWYSLNELKSEVKNKVNSDDFNVIPLIAGFQDLASALENITEVKLTLHNDLINSYTDLAQNAGMTFESMLRKALSTQVSQGVPTTVSKVADKVEEPKDDAGYKPKKVACRKCKSIMTVDSPKRPITITCPECGTKGKLSK